MLNPTTGAAQVDVRLHTDHVKTLQRILDDPNTIISDLERNQIRAALEEAVD